MATEFGNINKMTKTQFKESTEFYKSRIERIKVDETLDSKTKDWFIQNYEKKIKILKDSYEQLDGIINEARLSGNFVNENTATFESLGKTNNNKDPFENMEHPTTKLKIAKSFKILGAILLPVVGTIPFLVSMHRAKKRHEAVLDILQSENNEVETFINKSQRPYDATIGQDVAFSQIDMNNLLENQGEIMRLQNLLTSNDLNPIEKKNLTKKLIQLKEYAQKNGFTLNSGILDGTIKTDSDKTKETIANFKETSSSAIDKIEPVTNFKSAYDDIVNLDKIKSEANSLLADSSGNQDLLDIVKMADDKKSVIISELETTIITNINNLITTLNTTLSASSLPTTKDDCNNKKVDLKTAFDNGISSIFGLDFESASSKLSELGVLTSELDNLKTIYESKISLLDAEIAKFQSHDNHRNNIEFIDKALGEFEAGGLYEVAKLDTLTIDNAKSSFNDIEQKLDILKANYDHLPSDLQKKYRDAFLKFNRINKDFSAKKHEIGYTKMGFSVYQDLIKTDITSYNMFSIENFLHRLNTIKSEIEHENYISTFLENGGEKDTLENFKTMLSTKITEAETKKESLTKEQNSLTEKQQAEQNRLDNLKTGIETIESEISTNSNNMPWLKSSETQLNNYISILENEPFKSKAPDLLDKAKSYLTIITNTKEALEHTLDYKSTLTSSIDTYTAQVYYEIDIISNSNNKSEKGDAFNELTRIKGGLQNLKTDIPSDISTDTKIQDLIKKIDNLILFINNYTTVKSNSKDLS